MREELVAAVARATLRADVMVGALGRVCGVRLDHGSGVWVQIWSTQVPKTSSNSCLPRARPGCRSLPEGGQLVTLLRNPHPLGLDVFVAPRVTAVRSLDTRRAGSRRLGDNAYRAHDRGEDPRLIRIETKAIEIRRARLNKDFGVAFEHLMCVRVGQGKGGIRSIALRPGCVGDRSAVHTRPGGRHEWVDPTAGRPRDRASCGEPHGREVVIGLCKVDVHAPATTNGFPSR